MPPENGENEVKKRYDSDSNSNTESITVTTDDSCDGQKMNKQREDHATEKRRWILFSGMESSSKSKDEEPIRIATLNVDGFKSNISYIIWAY